MECCACAFVPSGSACVVVIFTKVALPRTQQKQSKVTLFQPALRLMYTCGTDWGVTVPTA